MKFYRYTNVIHYGIINDSILITVKDTLNNPILQMEPLGITDRLGIQEMQQITKEEFYSRMGQVIYNISRRLEE